jgi:hypothetical protein
MKCEITKALWGYGNPMSKANNHLLRCQINTIKFEDGTPIRYLTLNKSYKMLGVQINPMLDFRDHRKHVIIDVKHLAKVLAKLLLSPNRKKQVIDKLLKSKYRATHIEIFTNKQLETIYRLFNTVARIAIGLTPSFLTYPIHRPTTKMYGSWVRTTERSSDANGDRKHHKDHQQTKGKRIHSTRTHD